MIYLRNVWARMGHGAPDPSAVLAELEREIPTGAPSLRGVDPHLGPDGSPAFLSGVASLVAERLGVPITDERAKLQFRGFDKTGLRDYQEDAISAALKNTRGLISMPTGSGKTRVAAGIIDAVPLTWLYLAHRTTLIEQSARVFEQVLHEPIGRVGDGSATLARVTCATYASLAAAMKGREGGKGGLLNLLDSEGLIVDEAHRLPCATAFDIVSRMERAYYRIGLGATNLLRGDGKNMLTVGLLGPTIYEIGVPTLVRRGYLAQGRVAWRLHRQPEVRGQWSELYGELIAGSESRNQAVCSLMATAESPMIVFVRELEHGRRLLELADKHFGVGFAAYVTGDSSVQERQDRVAELRAGKLRAVISTAVFEEGMDAPEIRSVVVASAGKSTIRAIQQMGRATRPAADKTGFTLYDVADVGPPALERHTWERAEAYRLTGYDVADPMPIRVVRKEAAPRSRAHTPARETSYGARSLGASLAPERSLAWSVIGTIFFMAWLVLIFMLFIWAPLSRRQ